MLQSTVAEAAVTDRLDPGPGAEGAPLGAGARAGLADFLRFVAQAGVERARRERVRLPVQKRLALVAALAAGCRSARDRDFVLAPDPAAPAALGLPRWPHSSQLTRHLRAVRAQHVRALRAAFEEVVAGHARARRRLRRGERVVVDLDQTPLPATGRADERAATGRFKKKGERGDQATAACAGDTGGGEDEVLAVVLDPGTAHASWRFADALAALGRVLGPLARPARPAPALRLPGRHPGRPGRAAAAPAPLRRAARRRPHRRDLGAGAGAGRRLGRAEPGQVGLRPGPGAGLAHPDVAVRRRLVRSGGAGQRPGDTAIVTNLPAAELPAAELAAFSEARQTIEGWLSEASAALQLKGPWSRGFDGLEAFLLHAALASNRRNWWERRAVLPGSGLPRLGLRQLIGRVIALPARVLRTADGRLTLLLPPTHPDARCLVPTGPGRQLPLPFSEFARCDAHF